MAGTTALEHSNVLQVIAVQFISATAALMLIRRLTGRRKLRMESAAASSAAEKSFGYGIGIVGLGGTMVLQYIAFANAPIMDANIIAYSWPMLAAIYLAVTALNTSTVASVVISLIGFGGVTLIVAGQTATDNGTGNVVLGYCAAVGSAACMAVYTLGMRTVRIPVLDLMLMTTAVGGVGAVLTMIVTTTPVAISSEAGLAIYIGIGPVALGYTLWSFGMKLSGGRLAPLGFMTPVLSTLVLLLGGNAFGGVTALGAGIVLLCTVAVLVVDRLFGNASL
ncbi:hypothetical protein [Rhodococcus sp. H29-C3]|uniref:DMT family transporter n=1 Tax=Rhodococcus sp. H29-C3 TaxID=3046307 RepID=UPI0024B8E55B|nr:hypothetical protein [Rhodococcus sp. H29-C3]MDJ0363143.1 hypothetical protein [Rhodococcus sp. H29-C3]